MRVVAVAMAALLVGTAACGDDGSTGSVVGLGPGSFLLTPTAISLAPGGTEQIRVTASPGAVVLNEFVVADSCVARVSATGLVTGVGPGTTVLSLAVRVSGQTYTTSLPVTVTEPAVLRLTIQSITAGAPPTPVDPNAVRGTISVVVNADAGAYDGFELMLAGKPVGTAALASDTGLVSRAFAVNTAARDDAGAPLYPNGPQTLTARISHRTRAPGCRRADTVAMLAALTLANP